MREPEGIETPLPGKSSERSWSKHREPDIRNVEAEGSSPFTSTKRPRSEGLKWDPPEFHLVRRNLRDLIGVESADERYVALRRGRPCAAVTPTQRPGSWI